MRNKIDRRSQVARAVERLESKGVNWCAWSAQHGFPFKSVYAVVAGKVKCQRGISYEIAMAMGAIRPPRGKKAPDVRSRSKARHEANEGE